MIQCIIDTTKKATPCINDFSGIKFISIMGNIDNKLSQYTSSTQIGILC